MNEREAEPSRFFMFTMHGLRLLGALTSCFTGLTCLVQ